MEKQRRGWIGGPATGISATGNGQRPGGPARGFGECMGDIFAQVSDAEDVDVLVVEEC
jgi:hypothetical protein